MRLNNSKKKILLVLAVSFIMRASLIAQLPQTIEIINPSAISRPDELVTLQKNEINKQLHIIPQHISISNAGRQIPVQYIDEDGDDKWDEVVFLYSFRPNEKASFQIAPSPSNISLTIKQRAHVRLRKKNADDTFGPALSSDTMPFQNPATDFSKQPLPPYLTEGPAWENDKVAFRLYFDVRNNKDIYGKTTAEMMMDTVGANSKVSYHDLSDWGMDVLHVARSLGAGALALLVPRQGKEDTLIRLGGKSINNTVYQRVADGPLLAKFFISYDWQIQDKPIQVREEISIWGGQYFYDGKVTLKGAPPGSALVNGIADFYENTFKTITEDKAVIGCSYGRQSENKDNLGLAVLVKKAKFIKAAAIKKSNADINETYIIAQSVAKNSPLSYRFFAGWEKSDKRFSTMGGFENYLKEEAVRLSEPIKIIWMKG